MGVMSCSRYYCDNIMCHTYISEIGYICFDCQKEFKEYLKKQGISVNTEGEIKRELKKFMETEKDSFSEGKEISIDDFFNDYTKY